MKRTTIANRNSVSLRRLKPVQNYLEKKYFKDNRLWHIVGGKLITKIGDEYLSESEFDDRYMRDIPTILFANPHNKNILKNWSL